MNAMYQNVFIIIDKDLTNDGKVITILEICTTSLIRVAAA